MGDVDLFDEAVCAVCGQEIEGEAHPLQMRTRTLTLCGQCAEDPLGASYVARKRARRIILDGLKLLDVEQRLEDLQTEGRI